MKFRTTGILLMIAVTIGAFIWFFERHTGDTKTREMESRMVLDMDPERIDWLQIETTNYLVSCERDDKTWTMTEPIHTRANGGEIQRILMYLEDWRRQETIRAAAIKKSGVDPTVYGVHVPRLKITLRGDGEEQVLRVGRNTPLGDFLYVQIAGEPDILAASTNLWSVIPEAMTPLRSRRVFDGVPSDVRRFQLKRKEGLLEISRSETQGWVLEQPLQGRANVTFVNDLLFSFFSAGVEAFVFDDASELSPYGLDEPRAQISLWTDEEEEEPQVLLLGDVTEDAADLVYAMREGGKTVFSVKESLYTSASMTASILRDRRLIDMDERAVSYLQIIAGEESLSLQKDDAGSWSLVKPVQRKAQDSLVRDLVTMWAQVGIKDFVADDVVNLAEYGLNPPTFEINFFAAPPAQEVVTTTNTQDVVDAAGGADDDRVESTRIALGSVDAEKERLLIQVGNTPSVMAVHLRMLRRLSVRPVFYFDREVLALAAEDIREIKLQSGGLTQIVARADAENFRIADDSVANHPVLVSDQVETLLRELQSLQVESFVTQSPEDLVAYGLDQPSGELILGLTGEAGISKALITGAPFEEQGVYAMIRGQDVVFVLANDLRDTLFAPLYAERTDVQPPEGDVPEPMLIEP